MENLYLVQLLGIILFTAGLIALAASAHILGPRISPAHKRMSSDEWNRRRSAHRWPVTLEALAVLVWSRFSLSRFLFYWIPSLPPAVRLFLSCT